ncbi:hypothetical protein BCD67_21820 [Oscillatoriales cyanobacterium USR001]|nr:hypothetical protein BCD67_21820 [Oscillatoriales cyanobacterium USR001]
MKWRLILIFILPLAVGIFFNIEASAWLTVQTPPRQPSPPRRQSSPSTPQRQPPQPLAETRNPPTATPLSFTLPPKGAPGNREGASGRGDCTVVGKAPLTALIPGTNIGLTIAERPTFWFYVPYQSNPRILVEFSLTDDRENTVYKAAFQLMDTPGIVGINLPPNTPGLEVGKTYRWELKIVCDPANPREFESVDGAIERVRLEESLKQKIDRVNGRDRVLIYAQNGLWYDTLTNLIQLRRQNPKDAQLAKDWEDLLQQSPDIPLDKIVNERVVNCCTPR